MIVGAGIFAVPATLAACVGPYAPLTFLACGFAIGAVAICFAEGGFMVPGSLGEVVMAREIVPAINELAAAVRKAGGLVTRVKNSTTDTRASWSTFHEFLCSSAKREERYAAMDAAHTGHELWGRLDVARADVQIVKKRFSAFLKGSSDIEALLRNRGIDTVLIFGTATNICCDCTARDAMMLNFKTVMVSDALAARSDEDHSGALVSFYTTFGDVRTAAECQKMLLGVPATQSM